LFSALHHFLLFFLELFVLERLQGFGNARGPDPAGAEASDVEFALLDCVFIVCEGGEERGLVGAGAVVWAVVRGGAAV
jgi:hypothetical protein